MHHLLCPTPPSNKARWFAAFGREAFHHLIARVNAVALQAAVALNLLQQALADSPVEQLPSAIWVSGKSHVVTGPCNYCLIVTGQQEGLFTLTTWLLALD